MSYLMQADPEVAEAIRQETRRQAGKLEMIASENFVSEAVLEAQGSVMTNKYAEGYPGRRYYGGCEFVDIVERLAIERSKQLFGAEHVNVQAHAGVQANMAVYFSVLEPGDTILGMNLSHGGHLSHGSPASFSGRFYRGVFYGVDRKTETIDFNEVETLAKQHQPKIIVVGASAYPRTIDYEKFRTIADQVGALILADIAHIGGLVAAGLHPSPVPELRIRHDDHPQDPPGTARGAHHVQAAVRPGPRRQDLSGDAGRPPHAHHRRQGRGAQGGPHRRLQTVSGPDREKREDPRRDAPGGRFPPRLGRHGQPPDAGRSDRSGHHRQGGAGDPRPDGHHDQQERASPSTRRVRR